MKPSVAQVLDALKQPETQAALQQVGVAFKKKSRWRESSTWNAIGSLSLAVSSVWPPAAMVAVVCGLAGIALREG